MPYHIQNNEINVTFLEQGKISYQDKLIGSQWIKNRSQKSRQKTCKQQTVTLSPDWCTKCLPRELSWALPSTVKKVPCDRYCGSETLLFPGSGNERPLPVPSSNVALGIMKWELLMLCGPLPPLAPGSAPLIALQLINTTPLLHVIKGNSTRSKYSEINFENISGASSDQSNHLQCLDAVLHEICLL